MSLDVNSASRDGWSVVTASGDLDSETAEEFRAAVERFRPRLVLERLPAYAPMLNPVEPVWSWLKYSRLANAAPASAAELDPPVRRALDAVRDDPEFLRSMWQGSDLPLPRALLI